MTRPVHLSDLRTRAEELRALAPSCGPVRLVAVDGHAGSGKSTFAARLAEALGGAPVLHLDDLASHEALFGWTGRLRTEVLDPLSRGEAAAYHPYDWISRRFGPPRLLAPAPVVLVEGWAPAAAPCARGWPGCCGWTGGPRSPGGAADCGTARAGRVLGRMDSGGDPPFRPRPSLPYADALVRECPEGYMWLPRRPAAADPEPHPHGP